VLDGRAHGPVVAALAAAAAAAPIERAHLVRRAKWAFVAASREVARAPAPERVGGGAVRGAVFEAAVQAQLDLLRLFVS
jgi:hypothetical protein